MKKIYLLLLSLGLLLTSACSFWSSEESDDTDNNNGSVVTNDTDNANVDTSETKYSVKSGIVTYKLSGSKEGTATMYFDDYGKREVTFTKTDKGINEDSAYIVDGPVIRTYDFLNEKGTITHRSEKAMTAQREEFRKKAEDIESYSDTMTILERECFMRELTQDDSDLKTCYWKRIPLYTSGASGKGVKIEAEAISVEIDVEIPERKFNLPVEDSELKEVPSLI